MPSSTSIVYLIPCFLSEDSEDVLPSYITAAAKKCTVFFVENERSARRFLKKIWKEIAIDELTWYSIHKVEEDMRQPFTMHLKNGDHIGIISEAGCPGIADPGQILVKQAQEAGATIKPLVGPNSILLALMGSGMSGQQFHFHGYLPVDALQRTKEIKALELESQRKNCTQIFIETPYRNDQLVEAVLKTCMPETQFCIAANLTSPQEFIKTHSIKEWRNKVPALHKQPVIFCLYAGG